MEIIASMHSDRPEATSTPDPKNPSRPQDLPVNDRRRARRHKILTPAYANRSGSSQGAVLELSEILNLSESGMCIQTASQLKVDRLLPLGIDLAGSGEHIRTVAHVAWSQPSGKTGVRFPEMAEALRLQLRHWLAANAAGEPAASAPPDANSLSPLGFGNDRQLDDRDQLAPALSSMNDAELVPPSSRSRRTILLLLLALLFVGIAICLGARWKATLNRNSATSNPASSPASSTVPSETYMGADLKTLQGRAVAGDSAAEYRLGLRYATGEDVQQNYSEAIRWFLLAADQGNVHAQATVAAWMLAGRGAPQDYTQAYYWALLAQAAGDESGRAIVLNSAPYLSPVQTSAAQKQADDWLHAHHIGKAPADSAP